MGSVLRSLDSSTLVALGFLVLVHVLMVFGPVVVRTSPEEIDPASVFAAPSAEHVLGTDEAGRDVLARLLHGGRVTLSVALAAMLISVTASKAGTAHGKHALSEQNASPRGVDDHHRPVTRPTVARPDR